MKWWRDGVASVFSIILAGPLSTVAAELQPFQMIRSLQVAQDQIANGDHAALPMQRKLLGIIDERLLSTAPEEFNDVRNLNALLIYGSSGGNPRTLERIISSLDLEEPKQKLAEGILHYAHGDLASARKILDDVNPLELDGAVAAPLALLTGSLLVQQSPEQSLKLFDKARLLSPGTLIEEAALRRSLAVSAKSGDSARFKRAALQYVRRFLHSPYASQFAETFVSGAIMMQDKLDFALLDDVAALMTDDHADAIFLRIARQSAIEGHRELLEFASKRVTEHALQTQTDDDDPRAMLYANMASVTSDNVDEVLDTLRNIDTGHLSVSDRELLEAATRLAKSIVAPPRFSDEAVLQAETKPEDPVAPAADNSKTTEDSEAYNEEFVTETQQKLQAIDALLGRGSG